MIGLSLLFPPEVIAQTIQKKGLVTAQLDAPSVKAVEPGIAEITLVIRLTGPTGLEVREAQIEDAFSGWKPVSSSCASSSAGLGAEWIQEIVLRQSKPGQVPLPAVKVTFRAGPEAAWETVEWTDLQEVRGLPTPVEVPALPSPAARWRAGTAVGLAVVNVLLLGGAAWAWCRRPRRRPALTPEQWAERELDAAAALSDPAAAHARLADAVRGFLARRFQLPGAQQTTTEFLEALSARRCSRRNGAER